MSAKKAGCKLGKRHSRVYLMGKQAQYLSYQIEGGTQPPRGMAIAVPTSNLKLNKYGNIIGGQNRIKRLLKKKYVFQGTIHQWCCRYMVTLQSGKALRWC